MPLPLAMSAIIHVGPGCDEQPERLGIGRTGLGVSSQPAAQIGAGRVRQVVVDLAPHALHLRAEEAAEVVEDGAGHVIFITHLLVL